MPQAQLDLLNKIIIEREKPRVISEGTYKIKSAQTISGSALQEIEDELVYSYGSIFYNRLEARTLLEEVGIEWTHKTGNWPKRFAKTMKKNGKIFDNNFLSKIGKIARESCLTFAGDKLIVTKNFDWKPGDYGDNDSCYWGCRSAALIILRDLRGKALLMKDEDDMPVGRCWCVPHGRFYVLFNAYVADETPLSIVSFARTVSDIFNFPYYRNIRLYNCESTEGPLWINNGRAYIVGGQEIATIEELDFDYPLYCDECENECEGSAVLVDDKVVCGNCDEDSCYCVNCNTRMHSDDSHYQGDDTEDPYCTACFRSLFTRCDRCEEYWEWKTEIQKVGDEDWCQYCYDNYSLDCRRCSKTIDTDHAVWIADGNFNVCPECADQTYHECTECNRLTNKDDLTLVEGTNYICTECLNKFYFFCDGCREIFEIGELAPGSALGNQYCVACADKEEVA